jgi:hypothetical protein
MDVFVDAGEFPLSCANAYGDALPPAFAAEEANFVETAILDKAKAVPRGAGTDRNRNRDRDRGRRDEGS